MHNIREMTHTASYETVRNAWVWLKALLRYTVITLFKNVISIMDVGQIGVAYSSMELTNMEGTLR